MSVEHLNLISLISYIAAGFFFLVSIALFFLLDVMKLFGDVSGSNARKAIKSIKKQNENTGMAAYGSTPSKTNKKNNASNKKLPPLQMPSTGEITTAELKAAETKPLEVAETTVLSSGETTVLGDTQFVEETDNFENTGFDNDFVTDDALKTADEVIVEFEIGFIGTDEIIE